VREQQAPAQPRRSNNVHRLPLDLDGPDSEHAKLDVAGESDRMTLRFVKP
jgi:predicted methyltransferase